MPRRAWALALVLPCLLAACGSSGSGAHRHFTRADVEELVRSMAAPWPKIQTRAGAYPDYTDAYRTPAETRYGDSLVGYAQMRLGVRLRDRAAVDSGIRAVSYAVRRWGGLRGAVLQSVFENWSVASAYNLARRRLAGNPLFARSRAEWESFLRDSRAERVTITRSYGNHWLVDASGALETLASGLRSPKPRAVLGGRRSAVRAGVLELVNRRVPAMAPGASGPFLLSDPPDQPLAYEGLSLGVYAHLVRALGPRASSGARDTLRRAADALWVDTAPDGDSAYFGRSQEMSWGAAGAAYGALVAANLPGTGAAAAARYRALADRSFARLRDAYPVGARGQLFVPALAADLPAAMAGLDAYAGAPAMDGIALLFTELSLDEMRPDARLAPLAADSTMARALGSGAGRIGVVRRGGVWFAVRMRPTANRQHLGDLRYDSGLAIAKRRGDGGAWRDVVPVRPTTRPTGVDSAGPGIVRGGRVVGVAVGDRLDPVAGGLLVRGTIHERGPGTLAPLLARYSATACGVELVFSALPGRVYEYSAFFRGDRLPRRTRAAFAGDRQTVTVDPPPDSVVFQRGYGSAADPHLVRARLRFRVPSARTVRVTMC